MPNKKTESFSRPYFGPFKIDLYKNVEFYVPFSTKWYEHKNNQPILDNQGRYIPKRNLKNSIFVINKKNEYKGIIHFANMVIVPTNTNFLTKINIKDYKNGLLTVQEKFVNDENNFDEIDNKFNSQIRKYLNSSDYNINNKFRELLEWADNYDLLPFPQNPPGCPTREQFERGSRNWTPLVIFFTILAFVVTITLALVFGSNS